MSSGANNMLSSSRSNDSPEDALHDVSGQRGGHSSSTRAWWPGRTRCGTHCLSQRFESAEIFAIVGQDALRLLFESGDIAA